MRRLTTGKAKRRNQGRLRAAMAWLSPRALLSVLWAAVRAPFGGPKRGGRKTTGRKKRALRRRRHPLFNWRMLRLAGIGATPLLIVAGGLWLWQDGWFGRQATRAIDLAYAASATAGLRVDDLLVEGRARTRRSAIVGVLGVERGMPILAFDLALAQKRLEALPWVRGSVVERRLPDEIFVQLDERRPMALWQRDGEVFLVDETGVVVPGIDTRDYARLPLVVGHGAPQHAAELIAVLDSEADLRSKVTAAVWVSGRRWNLELEGGISVRLPEGGLAAAWRQLAEVERTQGLLARDVVMVDLRLPDRLVVRTAPGVEPIERGGENT